jgi:hypothetical protein
MGSEAEPEIEVRAPYATYGALPSCENRVSKRPQDHSPEIKVCDPSPEIKASTSSKTTIIKNQS